MKLTRRMTAMLLNALIVQQDYFHKTDDRAPVGAQFKDYETAIEIIKQEDEDNPYVYYKEFNELFSEIVYAYTHELSPEDESLLRRQPTEVM